MATKIICYGEVLWDTLPEGPLPGGAPMNVAYHLRQAGVDALVASSVGNDEAGRGLVRFLQEKALYSPLVQQHPSLPTCQVEVITGPGNEVSYRIPFPVAWDEIGMDEHLRMQASAADGILYGSLACRNAASLNTLLELLSQTSAVKIFDMNLRPPHFSLPQLRLLMGKAELLKMNETEYEYICSDLETDPAPEEGIPAIAHRFGCPVICVTQGSKGAFLWKEKQLHFQAAMPVQVVDTIGAGDAFLAGLLDGFFRKKSAEEMLAAGIRLGAFVAGSRGACPEYDISTILS